MDLAEKLVVWNGGHDSSLTDGGSMVDPGACSPVRPELGDYLDTQEAKWALEMANMCHERFTALGGRSIVVQNDDLDTVCGVANDNGANLFVAIHLNSVDNPEAHGVETFGCRNSQTGALVAGIVQPKLVEATGFVDRGVKTAGYYVLKYTNMPAILVECGFVSNPTEEAALDAAEMKAKIADALVAGVVESLRQLEG